MGKAGESTRKMAAQRRSKAIIYAFLALGIALMLFLLATNWLVLGIPGLGLLVVILGLKVLTDILTSRSERYSKMERRAIRGARGEETIARILDNLGPDFYALHDIDSRYGNIDHIVLSRLNGVLLVETKAHGGRVSVLDDRLLVNGRPPEKDFIAQSLRNTYWLKEELNKAFGLDVWITPVVVFANAFISGSKPIKGVTVINKKYLPDVLRQGRASQASIDLWNRREDVARWLGVRISAPFNGVAASPSATTATTATHVSQTPRRTQTTKRLFGLQRWQLGLVVGAFLFDLVIIGAGLVLVLR